MKMKRESLQTIRELMNRALEIRGITGEAAFLILEDHLGAQLEEKFTHGIGKFLLLDAALSEREGQSYVVKRTASCALVNGNKDLGQLAAKFSIDLLIDMAKQNGIAMVGMHNASRYGRLSVHGKRIADAGLLGIVMNNGGPSAVVPYGGIDPILGTNPICFSFPATDGGVAFDFSTSERVWGEIRQAVLENRELPNNAFLDKDGKITRDPEKAEAVLPFDGPKGYALCLAIEILAGALVSAKMGLAIDTQYDLGFLFIAIDPSVFLTQGVFQSDTNILFRSIHASRGRTSLDLPRLPGEGAMLKRRASEAEGSITVDEETLAKLVQMSKSVNGVLDSSNKMN